MNGLRKSIRSMAVLLSLACAVTVSGCQRENNPSGGLVSESMEVSSLVLDSEVGSQTSSEEPPVTSAEESQSSSAVSSMVSTSTTQADPSSISEDAPSQVESSQSDEKITILLNWENYSNYYQDIQGVHHWHDSDSVTEPFDAKLIHNTTELGEYKDLLNEGKEGNAFSFEYTDKFFENHALILMITDYNCVSYDEINFIGRSNHQLIIDYYTIKDLDTKPSGVKRIAAIPVDKKDIAGVTEIVPQQHVETLSEGSVYVLNGDEVRFRRPSESCE